MQSKCSVDKSQVLYVADISLITCLTNTKAQLHDREERETESGGSNSTNRLNHSLTHFYIFY